MKKLLLILLCLPLLFTTCKKEESTLDDISIYKAWLLSTQTTYLTQGDSTSFLIGVYIDPLSGIAYSGQIQYIDSVTILLSSDTIFPAESTLYSSRIWSFNENQVIIDTYYDDNGFAFNTSQHTFTKDLDTLVVNFQSGDIKKFLINKLTAYQLHIISIPDTNYIPLYDINGTYQDTILINLNYDKYFFELTH